MLGSDIKHWPQIALVTPVFNSGKYIEQTIQSVLAQGYPNLDYFIVDGGSTDNTMEVIRKYEGAISGWISEPDKGMYDALNKGFARTRGEIMGWISATDQLHIGGLKVVGGVFRQFPDVEWITGRPTVFSDDGMTIEIQNLKNWSRYRFLAGANRHIQQESTFWRRCLWEKAGSRVDSSYRNGADFELWVRFFRHAKLHSVDALIGGFRCHPDSIGLTGMAECDRVHDEFVEAELSRMPDARGTKLYRRIDRAVKRIPKVRVIWQRFLVDKITRALYQVPGSDWPSVIAYDLKSDKWVFRGE